MRQCPANRAAVANGGMGNQIGGLAQQRRMDRDQRIDGDLGVPGQRADPQASAVLGHAFQRGNPVDVDQQFGFRQTHVERRHQTLSTGEDTSIFAVLVEQLKRVFHAFCPHVRKFWRLHGHSLFCCFCVPENRAKCPISTAGVQGAKMD